MGKKKEKSVTLNLENAKMSDQALISYRKFKGIYESKLREAERTPLVVLIWGPGPSGGDLYTKRKQIRSTLREQGDAAVFSEEIDEESFDVRFSARARELLQAQGADFIILLYSSPGSIAEAHDFGVFKDIGSKMVLFIDSRYIHGYGYSGLLAELAHRYNNVHTYEYPQDITECHLIAKLQERLDDLRWAKWLADQGNFGKAA